MELAVALAWPAVILILGLAFISLLAVVAWRPDHAAPPVGPMLGEPTAEWQARYGPAFPTSTEWPDVKKEADLEAWAAVIKPTDPELPPIE